jgi:putative tryptophan/tyrosine transport system substrate-binding protein
MRRREFITLAGGVAASWPFAARAQQPAMPVIGYLNVRSRNGDIPFTAAFRRGLNEVGYIEGQNLAIEYRWAEEYYDRLPALAAELVQRQVAVIAAATSAAAQAAKAATATIPIVFESAGDPVQLGLVSSLNRPGSNVTGVTQTNVETEPKRLELLHELLPTTGVMAVLVNPADPLTKNQLKEAQSAARILGLELHVLNARTGDDFDAVFAKLIELRAGGLSISTNSLFTSRAEQLGALAARYAVPTIYKGREFTAVGGLMSYGTDTTDSYRLAGVYTGRILKGEKPADLPVQQVSKVELIINLKAAKALGITFPITLLGRADEVIE